MVVVWYWNGVGDVLGWYVIDMVLEWNGIGIGIFFGIEIVLGLVWYPYAIGTALVWRMGFRWYLNGNGMVLVRYRNGIGIVLAWY